MTDDEIVTTARAVVGDVLAACPRCGSFAPHRTNRGDYACVDCGLRFTEPAYYQRVAPPAPAAA